MAVPKLRSNFWKSTNLYQIRYTAILGNTNHWSRVGFIKFLIVDAIYKDHLTVLKFGMPTGFWKLLIKYHKFADTHMYCHHPTNLSSWILEIWLRCERWLTSCSHKIEELKNFATIFWKFRWTTLISLLVCGMFVSKDTEQRGGLTRQT